jgi:hypothetical protein
VCEQAGRPDEAREFGEQAERLWQEPLRPAGAAGATGAAGRERRAKGQGRTQRPVPVRQRQEIQEMLWVPAGLMKVLRG